MKESIQKYGDILPLRRILIEDKWPQWVLVYVRVHVCVSMHTHACAVVCEFKLHNLHIAIDFSEPTYLETASYSHPSEMTFSQSDSVRWRSLSCTLTFEVRLLKFCLHLYTATHLYLSITLHASV